MNNHTAYQSFCQHFSASKNKKQIIAWFLILSEGLSFLKGKGGLALFRACPNARQMVRGTDATGVNNSACASFHASGLLKGPAPCGELRALNA
jgi:hypothetical protein